MCEYLHLSVKEKDSGIKAILIPRERLANDSVSGKTSSSRDVLQDLAVNVGVSVVREDEVCVVAVGQTFLINSLRATKALRDILTCHFNMDTACV